MVFYTPVKRPPKPGKLLVTGAKLQASGSAMSLFDSGKTKGGYAMQAVRYEQQRDAALRWEHPQCLNCGSQSVFTQIVKR